MHTTIKGYYQNGQIILRELPPVTDKTEVLITFLTDGEETNTTEGKQTGKSQPVSSSALARPDKEDTSGYVILESGLGIDE